MNTHSGSKNSNPTSEQEILISDEDTNDMAFEAETSRQQDVENADLDDALDDDNDNPVSHTLIDAAENTGPEQKSDTEELDGEEQEDAER